MKRIFFTICLSITIIINSSYVVYAFKPNTLIKPLQDTDYTPQPYSKEELYQDIFMSMLIPYIDEAVSNYYGKSLSVYIPGKILSIERPNGYRTLYFVIKVQVSSYEGPHNFVGVDNITLSVAGKNIKVEKYEHVSTY